MYNFLVTAAEGAWDLPAYELDRDRFLEYTDKATRSRFLPLTAKDIEELKSLPTLFTYEGRDRPVRLGYIRRIRERAERLLIEYEFDDSVGPFDFSKLEPLKVRLDIDIDRWEMSRTHWAVKDEDLFGILAEAGLVDPSFVGEDRPSGRVEEMRFKVALSFPGEKREYVAAVAAELKKRLGRGSVFYDKDFVAQLAKRNLDTILQRIYLQNSDLVVVFLCSEYEKKEWCGIEWHAIRNKTDQEVMFMRFDKAEVTGVLRNDGYVPLEEHSPIEAARMIVERVRLNELPSSVART